MMREYVLSAGIVLGLLSAGPVLAEHPPLMIEHGTYNVHLLLHSIGVEEYTVMGASPDRLVMQTWVNSADRGMKRSSMSTLEMNASYGPVRFEQHSLPANTVLGEERKAAPTTDPPSE